MHTRLKIPTRQSRQRITNINRNRLILWLNPLPLPPRIQNLQRRHRLSEQQGNTPQIRMARRVQISDNPGLLEGPGFVVHVAEVVFADYIVGVVTEELGFGGEFEEVGEEDEEFGDDEGVAFAAEGFDFFEVVLEDGWMRPRVVAVEFGEVVDLDVVFD